MPPRADTRSRMPWRPVPSRCADGSNPTPSSWTANRRSSCRGQPDLHVARVRVLRDVPQRLEAAEVDGGLRLRGEAGHVPPGRLDGHRDRGLPVLVSPSAATEPLVRQERRIDASGQVAQVLERRSPSPLCRSVSSSAALTPVAVDQLFGQTQLDAESATSCCWAPSWSVPLRASGAPRPGRRPAVAAGRPSSSQPAVRCSGPGPPGTASPWTRGVELRAVDIGSLAGFRDRERARGARPDA